ncbi:hypothetical protein C8J57DRAFT_1460109, partial [Mycena rebaudengoi]
MKRRLNPESPASPQPAPRAPLTQFLTRPSKWFARSSSAPRVGLAVADDPPRASTSSATGARKPKISRPTDPRPILDLEGYQGVPGSRSVLDLSSRPSLALSHNTPNSPSNSVDLRFPPSPSSAHSPYSNHPYANNPSPGSIYG